MTLTIYSPKRTEEMSGLVRDVDRLIVALEALVDHLPDVVPTAPQHKNAKRRTKGVMQE